MEVVDVDVDHRRLGAAEPVGPPDAAVLLALPAVAGPNADLVIACAASKMLGLADQGDAVDQRLPAPDRCRAGPSRVRAWSAIGRVVGRDLGIGVQRLPQVVPEPFGVDRADAQDVGIGGDDLGRQRRADRPCCGRWPRRRSARRPGVSSDKRIGADLAQHRPRPGLRFRRMGGEAAAEARRPRWWANAARR